MVTQVKQATLGQAVDHYLDTLSAGGRAKTTLKLYRYLLCRFAQTVGESQDVGQVTTADATAYLAALRERSSTGGYPTTVTRVLKGFFAWLAETGEIEVNPMASIKPRMPAWNPVPPYSDEELRRLLESAVSPMEKAIIMLLADTGMRASELTGLRLADVDLDQGVLRVMGKGGKRRILALNEQPRRAVTDYLLDASPDNGHLWPDRLNRKNLYHLVSRVGKRAGVAKTFPHRFRHTFAMRFLGQTGNALALQSLLGHTSLIMVQHYIRAAQGEIALEAHKQHSLLNTLAQQEGGRPPQDKCQA